MTAFRSAKHYSQPQAAVAASVAVDTWRHAELYSLASGATLAKLAEIGVDLAGIEFAPTKDNSRNRVSGAGRCSTCGRPR